MLFWANHLKPFWWQLATSILTSLPPRGFQFFVASMVEDVEITQNSPANWQNLSFNVEAYTFSRPKSAAPKLTSNTNTNPAPLGGTFRTPRGRRNSRCRGSPGPCWNSLGRLALWGECFDEAKGSHTENNAMRNYVMFHLVEAMVPFIYGTPMNTSHCWRLSESVNLRWNMTVETGRWCSTIILFKFVLAI